MNNNIKMNYIYEYTNKQLKVVRNLQDKKKVRFSTLLKNELVKFAFDKETENQIIYTKKDIKPDGYFDRETVIEFIKSYYDDTKSTKKTYLNRYENKSKVLEDHVIYFNSVDFENEEFWTKFTKHKYIKQILSPISQFLKQTYPFSFTKLKEKITNTIKLEIDK